MAGSLSKRNKTNIKLGKILDITESISLIRNTQDKNNKVVLTGGCFDILHTGHLSLLKNAKKEGDFLTVFLESDEFIKKTKGKHRPINTQIDRAQILAELSCVDLVILLDRIFFNQDYDKLISDIKPAIIAVSQDDTLMDTKKSQAKKFGAQLVVVTKFIKNKSTSEIARFIEENENI